MLNKTEVLKVASLASIQITDKEAEKFQKQLLNILKIFKDIDKLDLKDIKETSQVTGLTNVLRSDKVECAADLTCTTVQEVLENVPCKKETEILVPKVIERQ